MVNKKRRQFDGEKLWGLRLIKWLLAFIVIAVVLLIFVVGVTHIDGDSMYPTLKNNNIVLYNKLNKTFERGDIIAIKMANGDNYVKRVIAVAGDTVDINNGIVTVNGEEEHYSNVPESTQLQSEKNYPLEIKEGQYFVLGDNREKSIDSRTFGPIAYSQTRGKVLFVK